MSHQHCHPLNLAVSYVHDLDVSFLQYKDVYSKLNLSVGCHLQGREQGRIRSWVEWPEAGLLLLNIKDNRWCGNIGRAHKSNGIYYVVDLQVCALILQQALSSHAVGL